MAENDIERLVVLVEDVLRNKKRSAGASHCARRRQLTNKAIARGSDPLISLSFVHSAISSLGSS